MSKLYLSADTDMIKTFRTARGNKRIDASIGYNESKYSDKIRTTVIRDDNKIELTVFDKNSEILTCTGTIYDGIKECKINQMYTLKV